MRWFSLSLLTGILLLTLQTTILARLPFPWLRPDLVLIFTLFLGFSTPTVPGGVLALLLGFFIDVFSGNSLGLYTFARPLIYLIAQLFRTHFYWQGISFQWLSVMGLALLEDFLIGILLRGLSPTPPRLSFGSSYGHLIPQALFTALVSPVFLSLFNRGAIWSAKRRDESG
jgi:rod shape-determining protein MreD